MRILSIDQSLTNCAYIIWEDGLVYDFGVLHTTNKDKEAVRIMYLIDNLAKIIKEENIEVIILEGLSLGSISNSVRVLAGLFYSIQILGERLGVPVIEFSPKTIKKFATGSGKAKKPEMWSALPQKIQEKFTDKVKTISSGKYDLADAYFIGKFYLENYK